MVLLSFGGVKSYTRICDCRGSALLTPALIKGQLYIQNMFLLLSQTTFLILIYRHHRLPIHLTWNLRVTLDLILTRVNSWVLRGLLQISPSLFPQLLHFSLDQGFSTLAPLTFWGSEFLCGHCSVHCKMFSSISSFFSLDTNSTNPSPSLLVWQPKMFRLWPI